MDYKRIYEQLIERARNRVPDGYVERHHVKPVCMGGSDSKENLVDLYPEEHFVAHALLLKIYKETKYRYALATAVNNMCFGSKKHKRISRRLYGWLKRELSLALSYANSGKKNPMFGKRWITNGIVNNLIPGEVQILPEGFRYGKSNVHSSEVRKRISEARKGSTLSEETKMKISDNLKGKTLSEETKRKISLAAKKPRRPPSEETRRKLSEANKKRNSFKA